MRFYRIVVSDPATGKVFIPNYNGRPGFTLAAADPALSTYTSLIPGASVFTVGGTNPAAQRVELDLPVIVGHSPGTEANPYVCVYGVGIAEVGQAANLNGMNIAIYGGMARGLPLAIPAQAGRLVSGQVRQCTGNWINNDQTLSFFLGTASSPSSNQTSGQPLSQATTIPVPASNADPANIVFQWVKGQPMMAAIVSALSTAFPKYTIKGAISGSLIWPSGQADTAYFATFPQFARYVNEISLKTIGGASPDLTLYPGVSITLQNNVFTVQDGTTQTVAKQIQFTDLIGQPTWNEPNKVQVTARMRSDISPGDYVTLPPGPGIIGGNAQAQTFNVQPGSTYSNAASGVIFSGNFQVSVVRHVGDSRGAGGTAWVTTLDCGSIGLKGDPLPALPVVYKPNNSWGFFLP
ncbi:hypothetical protein SBC1_31410 [Caballeronia sp. SBC1]|uniref:hypothetical protein n=1 Tax=Caballeronia sp. SBC1 TaxID=2705548 RepID=UPI0014093484|nr:hypothetical protein [Caballeronia sp. SBC1]QIN63117.1 hypothetical protein SBC1_31410 [Caballeronia sp. SBC1]